MWKVKSEEGESSAAAGRGLLMTVGHHCLPL